MEQMKKINNAIESFFKETFRLPTNEIKEKLALENLKIPVLVGEELTEEVSSILQEKKWIVSQEGDTIYLS